MSTITASSTFPSSNTKEQQPSPTPESIQDIATSHLIIALVLTVFALNLVFAVLYGYLTRRESPSLNLNLHFLFPSRLFHQDGSTPRDVEEGQEMGDRTAADAERHDAFEVEDWVDPWAYWGSDSEMEQGQMAGVVPMSAGSTKNRDASNVIDAGAADDGVSN